VNAAVTILIIILSLAGYTVTVLDPAKHIIIENGRFIAAQVDALNQNLETIADLAIATQNPPLAGATTHFSGLGAVPQDTQTIANNGTINVSGGTYIPLTASSAVGTSNITGCTKGQLVYLVNVGSNTITITDTGTLKLASNVALGQYDTLLLWCDGTNYIQVATSNN
jgi:YVTN family beta-propeller protein